HSIGRKPETLVGVEALHRLHQADIAFGDDLADGQAIAAIAHGDARHEPQVRGDELMRSVAVAMLTPALGEHVFLLRLQHRKLSDFFEVARQSAMRADTRQTSCSHESPSPAAVVSRIFSTKLPHPGEPLSINPLAHRLKPARSSQFLEILNDLGELGRKLTIKFE